MEYSMMFYEAVLSWGYIKSPEKCLQKSPYSEK
jgi:hypothetical protein